MKKSMRALCLMPAVIAVVLSAVGCAAKVDPQVPVTMPHIPEFTGTAPAAMGPDKRPHVYGSVPPPGSLPAKMPSNGN